MITWLRYVPHSSLCEYLSKGWEIADELHGTNHGEYSILMQATENAYLPVVGWEGLYDVSLKGEIRSLDRVMESKTAKRGYPRRMRGRTLSPGKSGRDGYLSVPLHRPNGEMKRVYVAHIVARAWLGERPIGYDVCHCDGDKTNNAAINLRYDTHKGNERDKRIHGTLPVGEALPHAVLSEDKVREIRRRAVHETTKKLAAAFGVSVGSIDLIIRRKTWAHLVPMAGEVGTLAADAKRAAVIKGRYAAHARRINPNRRLSDCGG